MILKPAQFLLRFDDLCPTLSVGPWQRLLPLIQEFRLRPILAIVPDNRDPELEVSPPDPEFWAQMRALEAVGATIALHGYRHLCQSTGRSLLPLHRHTEFAGVPEPTQRQWIHAGLAILRARGLNPKLWVAPRHGFDHATLRALRSEGIHVLSDGFACLPFSRDGITWIPQQLWGPLEKSDGLWTICIHSNSTSGSEVEELHAFLATHSAQFTSVDRVLAEFRPVSFGPLEHLHEACALWRMRASRFKKTWTRRS
jgi:predicted deacetylase